jgi:hypothetical protein
VFFGFLVAQVVDVAHADGLPIAVPNLNALINLSAPPSTPYVDVYGQKIASDWPGKVKSDADLIVNKVSEDSRLKLWDTAQSQNDAYGGCKSLGWHLKGTGYFRLSQYKGVWWLITPDGNPAFYRGLDTTPAMEWETTPTTGREQIFTGLPAKVGPFSEAWKGDLWGSDPGVVSYAFCTSNLIRKYGVDWQKSFTDVTIRRLKDWGFSGIGKWGDPIPGIPSFVVLDRKGVPDVIDGGHPDPFDPVTKAKLFDALSAQINPRLHDPTVVAWSLGNEGAEVIGDDEIAAILQGSADVPAKRALIDYAIDTFYRGNIQQLAIAWQCMLPSPITRNQLYQFSPSYMPDSDLEGIRQYYADQYYDLVEKTVKEIDPNHLYAGFWIVEGLLNDQSDWQLIARHSDLIGFDSYDSDFSSHNVSALITLTKKPVLCGEFSFPEGNADRGFSQFGLMSRDNEEDSGKAYVRYVTVAAKNRYCVGVNWFQYRDEPVTGRGPGYGSDLVYGENYAFGLVDVTDTPKWTLLSYVHQTNEIATQLHAGYK